MTVRKDFEIDADNGIMVSSFIGEDGIRYVDIRKTWRPDGQENKVPTRAGVAIPESIAEAVIKSMVNRYNKLDKEAEKLPPRKGKSKEEASDSDTKTNKKPKTKRKD